MGIIHCHVIHADRGVIKKIKQIAKSEAAAPWDISLSSNLEQAVEYLGEHECEILVAGVKDQSHQALSQLHNLQSELGHVPIVVIAPGKNVMLATQLLSAGVQDFITEAEIDQKSFLTRLLFAIHRFGSLQQCIHDFMQMQKATEKISLCSTCKQVRSETIDWQPLETFVQAYLHQDVSHGLCPDCYGRLLKRLEDKKAAHRLES